MATVRKNNKKTIITIICIILAVALVVTGITLYVKDSKIPQVNLYTIGNSDIYESINATGKVSAGATKSYSVGTVAVVKEVFVKVGDEVKQGDILATFDTSNYDEQIKSMQASYDQAKSSYNEAVESQKEAKSNLDKVNAQIAALEKEISELEKKIADDIEAAEQTTLPAELPTVPELPTMPSAQTPPEAPSIQPTAPAVDTFADAVSQLTDVISGLSEDPRVNGVIVSVVLQTVANEIANGNTSAEDIAAAVDAAVREAAEDGLIDTDQLSVDLDAAVNAINEAIEGINWEDNNQTVADSDIGQAIVDNLQSIADSDTLASLAESVTVPSISAEDVIQSVTESDSVKLATDQVTLTACYAQQQIYTTLAADSLVDSRKEVMNTTKSALDALQEARQQLADGWTAAFDGVVTECSIFPGEQTTLLSSGITIQNMDSLIVTISLGEYDIHKVKLDMPVTISSAYGSYEGKIISKAPVAGGGSSGGSIVDSFGSMMGISGLSSLTDTGSGVEVRISVDEPDENIIVGFDAAVEIHIGEFKGVPTVPAESMLHDKNGTYVYLYNEEEGTVTKTKITTGAMSYTEYEITSGLKQGDRIVYAPQSSFEETFEVKVAK